MSTTINATSIFTEMRSALQDIGNAVERLALSYRKGLEADAIGWADSVRSEFPTVPATFWEAIERVSEGRLLPDVVARGCSSMPVFGKMSLAEQRRVLDRGFEVWTEKADFRIVPAHLISPAALEQCVDRHGRVLGVEEQAAIARERNERRADYAARLAEKERIRASDEVGDGRLRWRAQGGRVYMLECPTKLTAKDLRAMLADLEASS